VGIVVNCSYSGLNRIPSIFPSHVRILQLVGNNITYFENDSFVSKGLVDLEVLKADFCKIRKIQPGAFNGITQLMYLSLESNDISEIIPGTFDMTSRLELLHLQYNKIEHLETDVFRGLVKLQYIDLKRNKLQYLHPDTFEGLPNLQTLYLSANPNLQIPNDRHFINSLSLKKLGISICNASSVSVETFGNVSALEWLNLSGNNQKSLDVSILKSLPRLSTLYLLGNPLQCDCQLQEVWQWCQDHNIQTAYKGIVPICDTPSEVEGIWWGVLEKGQCLQGNINYYADYRNTTYSYTPIEDVNKDTKTDTHTEDDQRKFNSSAVVQYVFPVSAVLFIFGTAGNVVLIIIATCNKDMRNVPNMYIINLAISDTIYLTAVFLDGLRDTISVTWLKGEIGCVFFAFFYRMSVGLTAYSIAVLSIQRYRVIVNPLHVHVSSQPTWRGTGAIICEVWIVAA
jgi:netrin-G1 ligand/netrin-G3 ligand